jgi:hypothetical protein
MLGFNPCDIGWIASAFSTAVSTCLAATTASPWVSYANATSGLPIPSVMLKGERLHLGDSASPLASGRQFVRPLPEALSLIAALITQSFWQRVAPSWNDDFKEV